MIGKDIARARAGQARGEEEGGALVAPAAGSSEIDVQIRTANAYPRDIAKAMDEAVSLAKMAAATPDRHGIPGGLWFRLERKDRDAPGGVRLIEGPSIRLAEIVAYSWRNLRIADRVVAIGDRQVTVEAIAFDLERNVAVRREVSRRIVSRDGRQYSDDMIEVTAKAAMAIARRNAIFDVVPRAFAEKVLAAARPQPSSFQPETPHQAETMLAWFRQQGIEAAAVLRKMGRRLPEEITAADLDTLRGYATAIRDGEATAEAIFGAADAEFEEAVAGSSKRASQDLESPRMEAALPPVSSSPPEVPPAKPAAARSTPSRPRTAAGAPTLAELTGEIVMFAGIKHASTIITAAQKTARDREDLVALVRFVIHKVKKEVVLAAAEENDPKLWESFFHTARVEMARMSPEAPAA